MKPDHLQPGRGASGGAFASARPLAVHLLLALQWLRARWAPWALWASRRLVRWSAGLVLGVLLSVTLPSPAAVARVGLVCQVTYQPAAQIWVRRVEIEHDAQRVSAVRIDGVAVYSFAIAGTLILTALDNERIQLDTASQTWRSDFRGLASAQGWCERG